MSKEEIRKLLGGYATNTLTESERKALYEAALEDQELFNALEEEEALKELLADPVSRAQVAQALAQPASGRQREGWRLRRWAWGGAIGAVAAVAIVFAVIRSNQPQNALPVQIASAERPAATAPAVPPSPVHAEKEQRAEPRQAAPPKAARPEVSQEIDSLLKAKDTEAQNTPPALPAASPPAAPQGAAQQLGQPGQSPQFGQVAPSSAVGGAAQLGLQSQGQAPKAINSFRDAIAPQNAQFARARAYDTSNLRYSLVKRDVNGAELPVAPDAELKADDEVRLNVLAAAPGNLVLYQLDAAGEWKPLASQIVAANTARTIPPEPIRVQSGAQRFRLALEPTGAALKVQESTTGVKKAVTATPATREAATPALTKEAEPAPLVLEFTLVGK